MKEITNCHSYFRSLSDTIAKIPIADIEAVSDILMRAYQRHQMTYVFGNGGSAALASHFACDLAKGTRNGSAKRFKVLALTDNVPLMTAWANDSSYEDIFAEQLAIFASPGDVAFAISASGNSPNVLKALKVARHAGVITAGLTGFEGGKMRALCDASVVIPADNMQLIEDLHLCVTHSLFTCIRSKIGRDAPIYAQMGPRLLPRSARR